MKKIVLAIPVLILVSLMLSAACHKTPPEGVEAKPPSPTSSPAVTPAAVESENPKLHISLRNNKCSVDKVGRVQTSWGRIVRFTIEGDCGDQRITIGDFRLNGSGADPIASQSPASAHTGQVLTVTLKPATEDLHSGTYKYHVKFNVEPSMEMAASDFDFEICPIWPCS